MVDAVSCDVLDVENADMHCAARKPGEANRCNEPDRKVGDAKATNLGRTVENIVYDPKPMNRDQIADECNEVEEGNGREEVRLKVPRYSALPRCSSLLPSAVRRSLTWAFLALCCEDATTRCERGVGAEAAARQLGVAASKLFGARPICTVQDPKS